MLKKLVKIRSNSELAENTKSAEIQKKKRKKENVFEKNR